MREIKFRAWIKDTIEENGRNDTGRKSQLSGS